MAKFLKRNRLTKEEQEKAVLTLCQALVVIKDFNEAASLLVDLFSRQEMEMIAKRLMIAKFLIQGKSYDDIRQNLKVSHATIARVSSWLEQSGAGYRLVIERSKNLKLSELSKSKISNWSQLRRRYPLYFWPQILLEEIVRKAQKRDRDKLLNTLDVLKKAGEKNQLFKQLENLLRR
ncbi:MAG: hypothetical protein HYV52_02770 [Parcubacteria group bacterium]|nr:hypothetical protein [Parcubacteria group bacterium]